jgi:hypothetical protein
MFTREYRIEQRDHRPRQEAHHHAGSRLFDMMDRDRKGDVTKEEPSSHRPGSPAGHQTSNDISIGAPGA